MYLMIFSVGMLRLPTTITSATTSLPAPWAQTVRVASATRSRKPTTPRTLVQAGERRASGRKPDGALKVPSVPFIGNPRVGLLWRSHSGGRHLAEQRETVKRS